MRSVTAGKRSFSPTTPSPSPPSPPPAAPFGFPCNSYNRVTVAAGAEVRFRRPTRLGDRLVATASERERHGLDGVYDVRVTVADEVVAVFTGRSKEVGGTLFDAGDPATGE